MKRFFEDLRSLNEVFPLFEIAICVGWVSLAAWSVFTLWGLKGALITAGLLFFLLTLAADAGLPKATGWVAAAVLAGVIFWATSHVLHVHPIAAFILACPLVVTYSEQYIYQCIAALRLKKKSTSASDGFSSKA